MTRFIFCLTLVLLSTPAVCDSQTILEQAIAYADDLAPVTAQEPATAPHASIVHGSMAFALAAHAFDGMASLYCMGQRTCREVGPFLKRYDGDSSPLRFATFKAVSALGIWLVKYLVHEKYPTAVTVFSFAEGGAMTALGIRAARFAQ